jgi:hypothetical protein
VGRLRLGRSRARRRQSFLSCRLASQKTNPMSRKKASTVHDTTTVANPSVGVKASGDVSRMTPYTCQCCRSPDRT